jgi:hypothetical protein
MATLRVSAAVFGRVRSLRLVVIGGRVGRRRALVGASNPKDAAGRAIRQDTTHGRVKTIRNSI